MTAKIFEYQGRGITVHYDAKRCIHAAECVRGLPGVFDTSRKPWVDPDGAGPDEIAAVVMRCPSGALHFQRKDGKGNEPVPVKNTIKLVADGPLFVRGELEITVPTGEVRARDSRLALCRCGGSQNKPFCDGSHTRIKFQDQGLLGKSPARAEIGAEGKGLKLTPVPNGPLAVKGEVEVISADGDSSCKGNKLFLCRCGASKNKPFCDGSHAQVGFTAE
jgi:CDGSH-type Zn-finger protein/uncharacterized Fe-S cluster protein YjdI